MNLSQPSESEQPEAVPSGHEHLPIVPKERYDLQILKSLRRILRSVDVYSSKLAQEHGVTVPQLICLLKVDELDGSLRHFFDSLKTYVGTRGQTYEFTQREIRLHFRISKTQMQRYMNHLLELEYVRQRGFANRGYRYEIAYWDDNEGLRQKLKNELHEQLKSVKTV